MKIENNNYMSNFPNTQLTSESFQLPTRFFNSLVGVDRILDQLNDISMLPKVSNFPPYNIRKDGEYTYVIEMAVAGFTREEIDITINQSKLTIVGSKPEEVGVSYIHKGIANRDFTREFTLADSIEVKSASMENGILVVMLENIIPEHKKMKKLDIL